MFAGRLDDRDALRSAVGSPPVENTDAALVLHAYLNGGEPALRQLRGAFVVFVFDRRSGRLLVLRDPLGYHPLFFAAAPDRLLLSPSLEELLRQEGVSKDVDRVTAAAWVMGRCVDETFFHDVARLMPGHLLRFDGDSVRTERYWLPAILDPPEPTDFARVHELFDLVLSRALDRCLDLGPAGILLSGGIDSATIAAVTTENSRRRGLPDPVALSIRFPERESDESATQRAVASALGIQHVLVPFEDAVGPEGLLLEALEMATWMPRPPLPWDSAIPFLARAAAGRGCRVVLGGEGSEWLHHEWFHSADLLRRLDLRVLGRLFAAERQCRGQPRRQVARRLLWQFGARALLLDAAVRVPAVDARAKVDALRLRKQAQSMPPWLIPDPQLRAELAERWLSTHVPLGRGSSYRRARRRLLDSPDMTVSMDHYQELSRRLGVERLDGFQDADVIEFLLRVPPELLVAGGLNKSLAQASIKRRLPGFDMRLLRNVHYEAALEEVLVPQVEQAVERLGGLPMLASLDVVDPVPLLKLATGGKVDVPPGYHQLWYALALEAWLQARL